MRLTKDIEIAGQKFRIRALGFIDITKLGTMAQTLPAIFLMEYMIKAGTIQPELEDLNDYPAEVVLKLAEEIQDLTMTQLKTSDPDLYNILKRAEETDGTPPPGLVV